MNASGLAKLLAKSKGAVKTAGNSALDIIKQVPSIEAQTALRLSDPEGYAKYLKALEEVYGPTEARQILTGHTTDAYHGTTDIIDELDKSKLGTSTLAESAQNNFFFAQDPQTAADYANLSIAKSKERTNLDKFEDMLTKKYGSFGLRDLTDSERSTLRLLNSKYEDVSFKPWSQAHEKLSSAHRTVLKTFDPELSTANQESVEILKTVEAAKKHFENQLKTASGPDKLRLTKNLEEETEKLQRLKEMLKDSLSIDNSTAGKEKVFKEYIKSLKDYASIPSELSDLEDISKWELSRLSELLNDSQIKAIKQAVESGRNVAYSKGQNVLPVKIRLDPDKTHIKDYMGQEYRDSSYAKELQDAKEAGKTATVFKNTYDPGSPKHVVKQDITAVSDPSLVRSKFAAFDPRFKDLPGLMAGGAAMTMAPQINTAFDDINKPMQVDPNLKLSAQDAQKQSLDDLKYGLGKWEELKRKIAKPLARSLDLSGGNDPQFQAIAETLFTTGLDPLNYVPGVAGLTAGATQLFTPSEEEMTKIKPSWQVDSKLEKLLSQKNKGK
ncbi:MAG: hypothetical protein RLZZ181_123 [Pseudomonadota bacterium]|jgi:hypothetical protein